MDRSATLYSLDSNATSSSDTTSSGYVARGIGSIFSRAIYAIGELALQGIENLVVLTRIYFIAQMLPNESAMNLKEVERLYRDLFEFSRQDLHLGSIRNLALRIIFRRICSRETDYLIRGVNKEPPKKRKRFLEDLVTMLDPIRLGSTAPKEGKGNVVAIAYKRCLSSTEVHSLVPFIEFCDKLAHSPELSTVIHLLEAGLLDFLLHAYDTGFHDPFAKSGRTSVFKTACVALIETIRELDIQPTVSNHPVFSWVSISSHSPVSRANNRGEGLTLQTDGSTRAPSLPPLSSSRSPLLLSFPDLGSPTGSTPSHVSPDLSPESFAVDSPLEIESPRSPRIDRPLPPLPFNNRILTPTHLKVNEFGSRFLPHTKSPIRCLLALESDKLLLIGHDNGLSVIDTFPHERSEDGSLVINGPDEAQARTIWTGKSVLQLSILEKGESNGEGAVLALVGPSALHSSDTKATGLGHSIRIYNLASLVSLAKWAATQKSDSPLDLGRLCKGRANKSPSRRMNSILKSLKCHSGKLSGALYDDLFSPSPVDDSKLVLEPSPFLVLDQRSTEWDMVDETSQLRWTKDFVSLITPLSTLHVVTYALWNYELHGTSGGCLLAVATRSTILLYESSAANRKFEFVKVIAELALPSCPGSITFCQQAADPKNIPAPAKPSDPPTFACDEHLSLFVVFNKKASYIRLADSTVRKAELHRGDQRSTTSDTWTTSTLRSRLSLDDSLKWIPPVQCPTPGRLGSANSITILTRGKNTHIVPCPIPVGSSSIPPIFATIWKSVPSSVSARVSVSTVSGSYFLQLIALGGEAGLEVQEIPLSLLQNSGQVAAPVEVVPLWKEEDLGGYTGFLCNGGHWDQSHHLYHRQHLSSLWRSPSAGSPDSHVEEYAMTKQMKEEQGLYGWYRKGVEDWRVFWVGGSRTNVGEER
ncbi:hypothetical protein C0991_008440 [Blastosporella zonata]|nr:hypothetical protein C0991_008440 [Blastosporella zonata]